VAADVVHGGALLPAAGHRGSGIALVWEVLTGVLVGGRMLTEVMTPSPDSQRTGNSATRSALTGAPWPADQPAQTTPSATMASATGTKPAILAPST
jgi:LDH2 family malate/lactate/ureidoglycolate dehydrogenase